MSRRFTLRRFVGTKKFIVRKVEEARKLTKTELKRKQLMEIATKGVNDEISLRFKIKTAASMLLNDLLIGRKRQTKLQYQQPVMFFDHNNGYKFSRDFIKNSENRGYRRYDAVLKTDDKKINLKMNNGEVWEAHAEYTYFVFDADHPPIIFVEFVGKPMNSQDEDQVKAYEISKKIITKGFIYNGIRYVYAFSSSAQQRTLKGVYVQEKYKIPEDYLKLFDLSIPGCKEYVDMIRGFEGAEAVYEIMTFGSYSLEYRGRDASPAKFASRVGTCHTSSKALCNLRVKHMGEVHVPWSDKLEHTLRLYYLSLVDDLTNASLFSEAAVDRIIEKIKKFWKTQKLDGQSVIRASVVIAGFAKIGIKLKTEDVVGKLIQLRYAGVKGTALCVPDGMLDVCRLPDGSFPYVDYDLIVEHSSWKFTHRAEFYTGELAPELELVAVSKSKHTSNMNYQFIQALDGDNNKLIKTKDKLHELINMKFDLAQYAMENPEFMKAFLGIISRDESVIDALDIDDYDRTLVTTMAAALDADERIIKDKSWRIKFVNRLTKMRDKVGYGKIPVDGANRFIISDPTAMFRTDLAVPRLDKEGKQIFDHEGKPMFDIVVTSLDQVAIGGVISAYWANNEKPAILFRSPCVHPGEPQRVDLIGIDKIPEVMHAAYGDIPIRDLFVAMKDIVVLNIFNNILDCLGGADCDGDTVLVVTEPIIVMLRNKRRLPMLTSTGGGTEKKIISPEAMREYMASSLRDSGIGRITNWATTFRDIESMTIYMPNPKGLYRLPMNVVKNLYACMREAEDALKLRRDKMAPDEIAVCEALSKIGSSEDKIKLNEDDNFAIWSRAVVDICEKALALLRRLQETSIETAKSGIFINFEDFKYLKLKVRATWHRRTRKPEDNYDSWSVMGDTNSYAEHKWDSLRSWAVETSSPMQIGNIDLTQYEEPYNQIREFKASFGAAMYNLSQKYRNMSDDYSKNDETEKSRMREFRDICDYFYNLLKQISIKVGSVDVISILAYKAVYDNDKGRDTKDDGLSFVWLCWGNEFVSTLKHYKSGAPSTRLVSVFMDKAYRNYTLPEGSYSVEDNDISVELNSESIVVAHSKVPDGEYRVICHEENNYVLLPVDKPTVESMTASLSGCPVRLIGFKYRQFNGEVLNRTLVKDLIARGGYVIKAEIDESGRIDKNGNLAPATIVSTEIDGEWVKVANIPEAGGKSDNSGYLSQALHNKKIRIIFRDGCDKKDPESRLTLEVVSIVEDLNA